MNKKHLKIMCACIFAISTMPFSQVLASAPAKDIVVTKDSTKVMSTYGDCVRTKWDTDTDHCRPHHKEHHGLHAIMKMDERIVYFDFDRAELKDSEKVKIDVIIGALKEHNVRAVKIVGYTDRIGTSSYNQRLSRQRAEAVRSYIRSKIKLDSSLINLRALGELDQVEKCEGVKERTALITCLAPNRRVEIEVDHVTHVKK